MRRFAPRQAGFTLLEVLVVMIVITILSCIAISQLFGAYHRSKQRATMADMRTIARAIETYSVDNSQLPDSTGGLAALVDELIPYTTNVLPLRDHWGHEYVYDRDIAENYSIESFGQDGVDGANLNRTHKFDYDSDLVLYNGVFVAAPE